MIHDAEVEVTCDGATRCSESTRIQLDYRYRNASEDSGFYDANDKAIEGKLGGEGWIVRNGKHYCSERCAG